MTQRFDIIVVGAGHAGIEAALAGARLGLRVFVATSNRSRVGYMSCNPSIGGLGKGHIVKEIDVLGGAMGRIADYACIQFRRLNERKGPAVRGSRAQCDKAVYSANANETLTEHQNITVAEIDVCELLILEGRCCGVRGRDGSEVLAKRVVITTGTFMRGMMFFGQSKISGGRLGDQATYGISDQLKSLGYSVTRLKTGTPPRLRRDSVNWDVLEAQYGDNKFVPFHFLGEQSPRLPQIPCFMTYTNERTHEIIQKNIHLSAMYSGMIEGVGPRYCPSVEDKITRFKDKDRHLSFLEPEGLNTDLIYLQGISTSLPTDVQQEFLQTMQGLEKVEIVHPGYAVEYDFFAPTQLKQTLELKEINGLFLAGQVNGTSGYEEAAGQGLIAGANAALSILEKDPLIFSRHEAYLGVLVDDLVTKGTDEPYRMLTSRAEHRLVLREDNVMARLLEKAGKLGLVSKEYLEAGRKFLEDSRGLRAALSGQKVVPDEKTQEWLANRNSPGLKKPCKLSELMLREEIGSLGARELLAESVSYDARVWEAVEIEIKYAGYISRQSELIGQAAQAERTQIPIDVDFAMVRGLSTEEKEKLSKIRPTTIGQAQRISGVNPSAIQSLLVFLKSRERISSTYERKH